MFTSNTIIEVHWHSASKTHLVDKPSRTHLKQFLKSNLFPKSKFQFNTSIVGAERTSVKPQFHIIKKLNGTFLYKFKDIYNYV